MYVLTINGYYNMNYQIQNVNSERKWKV